MSMRLMGWLAAVLAMLITLALVSASLRTPGSDAGGRAAR